MSNYTVSKHAFPKKNDCDKSKCPVRRERIRKITKLEGDIKLLKTYGLPSPIADSNLDIARHFQRICNDGGCHR